MRGTIELRGGVRLAREHWEPSGGVGFNLSERFRIDVAAFSTSAESRTGTPSRDCGITLASCTRWNEPLENQPLE